MFSDRKARDGRPLSLDPLRVHGATLAAFFAASAAPTPLYRFYQERFALSPVLTTVVFAVYAMALLGALLVAGSISDHLGRKPVILGALLLEIAAMALFLFADGAGWLIAARIVQGIATGIAGASIGAALVDVDTARGQFVNAISPFGGMAVGALGTSALIQYAPAPLHLVYGLLLIVFAGQALGLWLVPETGERRPGLVASLAPRLAVPPQAKGRLALITPINIAGWALAGFYLSLAPSLVVSATGSQAPLTGGAMVSALMLGGAVTVALRRMKAPHANLTLGVAGLTSGLLALLVGVHGAGLGVLILGTLVSGAGLGASFLGCVGSLMPLARPDERASLLATLYVESYLAFSLPAIAGGYLAKQLGYSTTADIYAVGIIAMSLGGLTLLRLGQRE